MAEHAQDALAELLESLRQIDARELAEQIEIVIARGTTREVERKGRAKELTQTPLQPDEAYRVAVEMFVAWMEPLLIRKNIQYELSPDNDRSIDIDWRQDFVEKSPISPEELQLVSFPKLEAHELSEFEREVKNLLALLQEE